MALLFIAISWLTACEDGGKGSSVKGATLQLSFSDTGTAVSGGSGSILSSVSDAVTGDSGAAGLTSLKYYVASIVLYSDLTPTGSGFDIPADAKQWWVSMNDGWAPGEEFDAAANEDRFVDLLDAVDRERLSQNVNIDAGGIGTWNWIVIQVAPVVKLTGSVDVGGTILYTHPGSDTNATLGTGSQFTMLASASDLTAGPAEEAVFSDMSLGGGRYFKLDNPLVVTQEDVDLQKTFTLRIVVETEGMLQGWMGGPTNTFATHSSGGYFLGHDTSADGSGDYSQQIFAPFLNVVPILAPSDATIMREHYVIKYASTNMGYNVSNDILLNMYWDAADNTRALLGLELHAVTGDTHTGITGLENIVLYRFATPCTYEIAGGSGAYTVRDFLDDPIIADFLRLVNEGDVGTTMPGLVTGDGVADVPAAVPALSYTLESLTQLE